MDLQNIRIDRILADDEFNCRGRITPLDVHELAMDIDRQGLIQPVTVAPLSPERKVETGKDYLLVAGYRRYYAHKWHLEREEIPAVIRTDAMDEVEARFFNLSENLQRSELNICQEAKALKRLRELGVSREAAAKRTGKSPGWIQVRYMLLDLPEDIQELAAAGVLKQLDIRDLFSFVKVKDMEGMYEAARQIKDARSKGIKNLRTGPTKNNKNVKRLRKRPEIFEMINHLIDTIGPGLHTRCLAWAAGEIASSELYNDVAQWDRDFGDGRYTPPYPEE